MKHRVSLFIACFFVEVCTVGIAQVGAWQLRLPSSDGHGGLAPDVRFDPTGDVVAVGTLNDYMVAAKVTRGGRFLWSEEVVLGQGSAVAFNSDGSIALAGAGDGFFHSPSNASNDVAVASLSGEGAPLFVHAPPLDGNHTAGDLVVDQSGDLIVSGASGNYVPFASGYFSVQRIGGGSVWESTISPNPVNGHNPIGSAVALEQGPDGNVVATGWTYTLEEAIGLNGEPSAGTIRRNLVVAKFDRADGTILWQTVVDEPSAGFSVTIDAAGDVIVAGDYAELLPGNFGGVDFAVYKFSGVDGQQIWRTVIDGGVTDEAAHTVSIDSAGDVIAGGPLGLDNDAPFVLFQGPNPELTVVKLAGADGQEIWRSQFPNDVTVPQSPTALGVRGKANALALDGSGNVLVTGKVGGALVAAKFDSEGAHHWTASFGPGEGRAIDVGPDGSAVISGKAQPTNGDDEFFVAGLSISVPVAGKLLRLRDNGTAAKRQLKFVAKADLIDKLQTGSWEDPTQHGAEISVLDRGSGEQLSIPLPAMHWKSTGAGYLYRDTQGSAGPCSIVKISKRKIVAKCTGPEVDLLAENAPLGTVVVRLDFGDELGLGFCSEFGGDVKKNEATRYLAKGAAQPADCQL